MSLIKTLVPVIDIYCRLNQITGQFHLAHEFFFPGRCFVVSYRPHPTPTAPCQNAW